MLEEVERNAPLLKYTQAELSRTIGTPEVKA